MTTYRWRLVFLVSLVVYIHAVHNDWVLVGFVVAIGMARSYGREGKEKERRGQ